MYVVERVNGKKHEVKIERLTENEFDKIPVTRYFFRWRAEKENEVFKITIEGQQDILGLISLTEQADERIAINLLAVSKENQGRNRVYERLAGNLIAWACREAVRRFGENACVSLVPKTKLIKHYMDKYGMRKAGQSLFLSDEQLLILINEYDV